MNRSNLFAAFGAEIESFFFRFMEFLQNGGVETRQLARVRVPVVNDPRLMLALSRRYRRQW